MKPTRTEQEIQSDLLTLNKAAHLLRIPVATLRYWQHLGIGPDGFRIGRRVTYRIQDLNRWITEQQDCLAGRQSACVCRSSTWTSGT